MIRRLFALLMITLIALPGLIATAQDKDDKPRRQTRVETATSHYNLRYLPDDRYSGDDGDRRDYELLLDLHVPKEGKGPFPVVFYVHGGSWSGGTKEGQTEMARALNERGIAFVAFNYILRPKGIFPQVWWDFHNAARYLRKHADTYNLDPLRFGAYGISAGGWVISSASMPGGDYMATSSNNGAVTAAQLVEQGGKHKARSPEDDFAWLKPMRDPSPAWPGEAGGFSALAWDFAYHVMHGDAGSPSVQQWTGIGAKKPVLDAARGRGIRMVLTEMTAPKYAGKSVHVPPFFKKSSNEASDAIDLDGKPGKLLGEVVVDFFQRELMSPAARPPSPEIYPVPRMVSGPTQVSMLAPRGATIHYTTDGSDPTPTSTVYDKPFTVEPGTVVKAISTAPGMTPSGPATAHFVEGTPAPRIVGPDALPDAQTGKPYSVTFKADRADVRWQMQGDLVPHVPWKQKAVTYPNNMHLNRATGEWAGTPTQPGVYWVQVWVNDGPGTVAGYRNYRWTVRGEALAAEAAQAAVEDQNVELATLINWPAKDVEALLRILGEARLGVVTPDAAGDERVMLLARKPDAARANAAITAFLVKRQELAKQIERHD